MPRLLLARDTANKYRSLALADPSFDTPSPIDLLFDVDVFARILYGKRITIDDSMLAAFGSFFGWIIIGTVPLAPAVFFAKYLMQRV